MPTEDQPNAKYVSLSSIPRELIQHLLTFLDTADVGHLSRASRSLHVDCDYVFKNERKVEKLLTNVVRGKEEAALKMIAANPSLLLVESKAEDYSGRIIHGTPFEAALSAHDTRMAQKMLPYFDKIKNLEEGEPRRQFDAVFPEGVEALFLSEKESAYDFRPLVDIIISGQHVEEALAEFRVAMTAQKHIKNGSHFNMYHLMNAYYAYFTHYDALGNWDNRDLFWLKVIGFVQRQIPTNYAQTHCSGLLSVKNNPEAFKRSLDFTYGQGKFFPLTNQLGFDFACMPSGVVTDVSSPIDCAAAARALKIYVRQKQSSLLALGVSTNQSGLTKQGNTL